MKWHAGDTAFWRMEKRPLFSAFNRSLMCLQMHFQITITGPLKTSIHWSNIQKGLKGQNIDPLFTDTCVKPLTLKLANSHKKGRQAVLLHAADVKNFNKSRLPQCSLHEIDYCNTFYVATEPLKLTWQLNAWSWLGNWTLEVDLQLEQVQNAFWVNGYVRQTAQPCLLYWYTCGPCLLDWW